MILIGSCELQELNSHKSISVSTFARISVAVAPSVICLELNNSLFNADSMTIQKVKGLLYRLLKIPGSELKLSYESSKVSSNSVMQQYMN